MYTSIYMNVIWHRCSYHQWLHNEQKSDWASCFPSHLHESLVGAYPYVRPDMVFARSIFSGPSKVHLYQNIREVDSFVRNFIMDRMWHIICLAFILYLHKYNWVFLPLTYIILAQLMHARVSLLIYASNSQILFSRKTVQGLFADRKHFYFLLSLLLLFV